jgi:hypothetical protein
MYRQTDYKLAKEDLRELCKTLWLKPDNSLIEFYNIFDKGFSKLPVLQEPSEPAFLDPNSKENNSSDSDISSEANPEGNIDSPEGASKPEIKRAPDPAKITVQSAPNRVAEYFTIKFGEAGGIGAGVKNETPTQSRKFLFTDNYFPVSKRAIYQLFGTLPKKKARDATNVVDIGETINAIAKQGFFSKAIFKKEQEIFNEVVILNDFGGSMVAFEYLTDLLANIMADLFKVSNHKQNVTNYYFQNIISEYLYLNKSSTRFEKLNVFTRKFSNRRVAIIIVSDAGAARRSNTSARMYATVRMLTALEKVTPNIVWINPIPEAFWKNNTAARIANFVPMFDVSESGLKRAVSVLRGRELKKIY